jgi:hypothetical protein
MTKQITEVVTCGILDKKKTEIKHGNTSLDSLPMKRGGRGAHHLM